MRYKRYLAPVIASVTSGALILAACGGGSGKSATNASGSTQAAATPAGNASGAYGGATGATGSQSAATPAAGATPTAGATAAAATPTAGGAPSVVASASGGAVAASTGVKSGGTASAPAAVTSPAAAAAVAATGGATDTGVSASEIKLGTINMPEIPLGNVFILPYVRALDAFVRAENDRGSVYGRRLSLVNCNDGAGELSADLACIKKESEQDHVFALFGTLSWATGEWTNALTQYKLPDVADWGGDAADWYNQYMFPSHMSIPQEAAAGAQWALEVHRPKTYGLMCLNNPDMQLACHKIQQVLAPQGIHMVKKIDTDINTADMTSEVLNMRLASPDMIFMYMVNPGPVVKFVVEMGLQHYMPPMGLQADHLAAEAFGGALGSTPVGHFFTNTTYNLWGANMFAMLQKYAPGVHGLSHHITQAAYFGANSVLEPALHELGPNVTRTGLMAILNQGAWYSDPDMGQRFMWSNGHRLDPYTGNCFEYMFDYTSQNTVGNDNGSPNGLLPDKAEFVIHDRLDCGGAAGPPPANMVPGHGV